MRNTKHKYLVLMDFSESSYKALKYIISVAKLTKGEIHVCHVLNPEKIIDSDNQAAAIRDVESETQKIEKKLGSIVEVIATENIEASCHYVAGNIIFELELLINEIKPDLIVVGKKNNQSNFSGKLMSYLLDECVNAVLLVSSDAKLSIHSKISLAGDVKMIEKCNPQIISDLLKYILSPVTLFNVRKISEPGEKIELPVLWESFIGKSQDIHFEFQENSKVVQGLIEHVSSNKTELLCIGKSRNKNNAISRIFNKHSNTTEILKNIEIPILIMSTRK